MSDVVERFWSRVDTTGDCWLWTAGKTRQGYGAIRVRGVQMGAHRLSAMIHFGMFDRRLYVLHWCDTPACVRPSHLHLGDHAQNMHEKGDRGRARNQNSYKAECVHGHPLTEDNVFSNRGKQDRQCRTCARKRSLASYYRRKGVVNA